MNSVRDRFESPLEPLGLLVGVFLLVGGLGTIVGAPWSTNPELGAVALQLLGAVATAALGGALAWLAWAHED